MSYRRACLMGGHIFIMAYLTVGCALLEEMSYSGTDHTGSVSCRRACLTGGHVLQECLS